MRAFLLLAAAACVASTASAQLPTLRIHGQGWVEHGRIAASSDSLQGPVRDPVFSQSINYDGAALHGSGAQLTVEADLSANLEAAFGIGAVRATHSLASVNQGKSSAYFNVSLYKSYVAEARLTYYRGERENPWFSVTAGNFAYKYNENARNLGLYLLRGPVYPGLPMSGFQEPDMDTAIATQTGFKVHHAMGAFSHDLLFLNERNLPPTFDWSLAYVAKYRPLEAIEVGGGVNFYRVLPNSRSLETVDYFGSWEPSGDTVEYSHQGTKLMAMASIDFKPWLPFGGMGSQDFKLYAEAALLGVKNYGSVYDDPMERIPVMVGFNVPTFGILDLLALEVEWYGSPYRNDLVNIGNPNAIVADWMTKDRPIPSPLPVEGPYGDSDADNWKWSLLLQKTVARHIQFTAQVANDHFRPRPTATGEIWMEGGTATALTAPSDWYFMGRLGFFF